ncbi:DUF5712 family protein [Pedobacter nyackensis]|uniref:Molybdopterin-guanine dinucleotide biosynthesis protein MobB n=1 Tax=Pedobacter nyackensis TaxID=475255 RepID=A0A1W2F383_9SPHI|nr:DUF5712 family protein [Pedobacter nyackensis]SMD16282.1 hypothetical protein SAMN04488101_11970 [Pedobacter nyackensis]
MYINITDKVTADNKGSSGGLVHYLEKENRTCNKETPECWFNQERRDFEPYEVRRKIDSNKAQLRNDEAKFFLINISPSQKEINHLMEQYGELSAKEKLKQYAEKAMTEYAKNFKKSGVTSNKDLVWFAKLENNRYYTYKDAEVKNGDKKRGELKAGQQMHIQVIVSRKDATNKIRLSPMNSSRGRNVTHSKKMGQFDRVAFKQSGEKLFDQLFDFKRNLNETIAYANIKKNGNLAQREQLMILEKGLEINYESKSMANELVKGVADGVFKTATVMLESVGQTVSSFLQVIMEPVYNAGSGMNPKEGVGKRRKKRKQNEQEQEQGLSR